MSAPDPATGGPSDDPQAVRVRRLIWAGGAVVALWFIADGLKDLWPSASGTARVLIVVAAVVVVLAVALGVRTVVRRDRQD